MIFIFAQITNVLKTNTVIYFYVIIYKKKTTKTTANLFSACADNQLAFFLLKSRMITNITPSSANKTERVTGEEDCYLFLPNMFHENRECCLVFKLFISESIKFKTMKVSLKSQLCY